MHCFLWRRGYVFENIRYLAEFLDRTNWWPSCMREILPAPMNVLRTWKLIESTFGRELSKFLNALKFVKIHPVVFWFRGFWPIEWKAIAPTAGSLRWFSIISSNYSKAGKTPKGVTFHQHSPRHFCPARRLCGTTQTTPHKRRGSGLFQLSTPHHGVRSTESQFVGYRKTNVTSSEDRFDSHRRWITKGDTEEHNCQYPEVYFSKV